MSRWLAEGRAGWQKRDQVPFASQVLALDENTLDQVGRWLPNLRRLGQGDPGLLAGRLEGLFDVRSQQWKRVELLPEVQGNCKVCAPAMLEGLAAGTLRLFDRGYLSFAFFDEMSARGLWWVSRYATTSAIRSVTSVIKPMGSWMPS